jgi:hypothetical protein
MQFLFSFADAVGAKMREAKRAAEQEAQKAAPAGTSVALVLADRSKLARAEMEKNHHLISGSAVRRKAGDAGAAWAGHDAGKNADIGQSRVSGGRNTRPAIGQ